MNQEAIYSLALTRLPGIGIIGANHLVRKVGNATALFEERLHLKEQFPDISDKIIAALDAPSAVNYAEKEIEYACSKRIQCLTLNSEAYPSRLRDCNDAPILLFYRGNADLNMTRVINIIGTRRATDYGKGICMRLMSELKELQQDILVVSGLAYGIDINAHRAALQNGFSTVGVMAHGLDRIYPSVHRHTAIEMIDHGGLLTEYPSGTNPDPQNFVQRNRIVAGMSDATIVVESADKGGALITASIANSYNRDCFAFPGRVTDAYSIGCNRLISTNRAQLIRNAEDLLNAMSWNVEHKACMPVQRELFPDLSDNEMKICQLLQQHEDGMQINTLVVETDIPINKITGILFELEMKGVVRALAGSLYKLV